MRGELRLGAGCTEHVQRVSGALNPRVAVYAGLSVRTLRMYLAHPAYPLPCFRIGGKVLVRRADFDAWASRFRSAIDALVHEAMQGFWRMGVKVKFYLGRRWVFIDHHSRRRSKRIGDRATALEVARKIRERLLLGDLGLLRSDSEPFDAYARRWLADGAAPRKVSTHRFYTFNLDLHIIPVLGAQPVSTVTRADCRRVLTAARAKSLKVASLQGVQRTLSAVLSQAVDDGLLTGNPAFRMGKYLRRGDEPGTRFSHSRVRKPASCSRRSPPPGRSITRSSSVHFGRGCAWASCSRCSGAISTSPAASSKCGAISSRVASRRRRIRTGAASTFPRNSWRRSRIGWPPAGRRRSGLGPSFRRGSHEPRRRAARRGNFRRRVFVKVLEKAKLRQIRLHDLRHTFASQLIQQGESLTYVKEQMGHSSIQVTVDVYGHLVPGSNRAAVDRLDDGRLRIPDASEDADQVKAVGEREELPKENWSRRSDLNR